MSKSPQRLRFGICGLGFMGRTHLAHLIQHPAAEVVAVCDRDEGRLRGDFSNTVGNIHARSGEQTDLESLARYRDPAELIADPNVDVVLVALPTPLHAPTALAALAAGKHVLSEKPMARTSADCDRLCAAARDAQRTLMIGQCIRFWPQYELIREYMEAGRLGTIRFMLLRRVASPPGYGSDNWYLDHAQSGGAILDLHVHDIDFVQDCWGMPAELGAVGTTGPSGGLDHVVSTYRYPDGRYAVLEGGWIFQPPFAFDMQIMVHGDAGSLEWRMSAGPEVHFYSGGDEVEKLTCANETGWTRLSDYFINQVLSGDPVSRCMPESSRLSIALAECEAEAIATGKAGVPLV